MATTKHQTKRRRRFAYPPGTTPEQVAKALLKPVKQHPPRRELVPPKSA